MSVMMELLTEHECRSIVSKYKNEKYLLKKYDVDDFGDNLIRISIDLEDETLTFYGSRSPIKSIDSVTPDIIHSNKKIVVFEKAIIAASPLDYNALKQVLITLVQLHLTEEFRSRKWQWKYFNDDPRFELLIEENNRKMSDYKTVRSHGNLSCRNILFTQKGGCKLIGVKENLFAPPMYDFLQLIFFNTSEDFRQKHLDELRDFYCAALKKKALDQVDRLELSEKLLLPLVKLEVANRNFNSELEAILKNQRISREDCYEILNNKLGTRNYKLLNFELTPTGESNGFLGNYFKLKLWTEDKVIALFLKTMPQAGPSIQVIQESNCFAKELFAYTELVPKMLSLGITTIKDCLPECYFGRSDDLLVFEDLVLQNYRILPSQIPYNFNILTLCVKKLAKFHGSFLAMEAKGHFRFEENEQHLKEVFFIRDSTQAGAVLMRVGIKSVLDIIDFFPEIDFDEAFKTLIWPKLLDVFYDAIKPSMRFKNVVAHGDLWTNNILVKKDNDEAVDCRFVDYQITRYCPPAHDFLSLLYLTTDRENRLNYAQVLEGIYYSELDKVLQIYNLEIQKIITREEFSKSVEYIKPQMVIQSLIYNSLAMCTSEEIAEFLGDPEVHRKTFFEDRKEFLLAMCRKSERYSDKLKEGALDLYEISLQFRN